MLYPLTFQPVFKERVWGGRDLERLYAKDLPPGVPVGESWEITDRPEGVSVIANGPLAGRDLRWLMEQHAPELLGDLPPQNGRFPWLIKLLDAQEKLSLQVHPPAALAAQMGGEPKTELWYIAEAAPGAELYVGLKTGVTRADFEAALRSGAVAGCFHRIAPRTGDSMFLPSGRVHALGGGNVVFEIQQNSDTTYRVFDWNRTGLDGQPRELHIEQSLRCIDFDDFEPSLVQTPWETVAGWQGRVLARHPLFAVTLWRTEDTTRVHPRTGRGPRVLGVVSGGLASGELALAPGQFCLEPAQGRIAEFTARPGTVLLEVCPGATLDFQS